MALLSINEYAESRGTSNKYIYQLLEKGIIPSEAVDKSGNKTLIDKEKADVALENNVENKTKSDSQTESLIKARTAAHSIKAALLKNAYDKETGKLIDAEKVRVAAMETAIQVRDSLLNIPDRISAIVAAESDPHKVHTLIDSEIRKSLEALADALES